MALLASGVRAGEGVGIIEAPRGTLIHHYKVNEQDLVTMCKLIVSTTGNNQAMNPDGLPRAAGTRRSEVSPRSFPSGQHDALR